MKKAKNALAIIAFVVAVLAALLAIGLPILDGILIQQVEMADLQNHLTQGMFENIKGFFVFDWFNDIANHIPELIGLCLAGVGIVLFIILFVFMLVKKHAKGLGWFFPMLIVYLLAVVVVIANKFDNAGYSVRSYVEVATFGQVATYASIGAAGLFILADVFYIVYVCKARKAEVVDDARQKAIAKIESLLGGNK